MDQTSGERRNGAENLEMYRSAILQFLSEYRSSPNSWDKLEVDWTHGQIGADQSLSQNIVRVDADEQGVYEVHFADGSYYHFGNRAKERINALAGRE